MEKGKWMVVMIFGLLSVSVSAQTTADYPKTMEAEKLLENIAGSWKLERIVDVERNEVIPDGRNNSAAGGSETPTPDMSQNGMQMIEFHRNARYRLNNATTAVDSGSYRINEQHGILYLESDADDITPSEWNITVGEGTLTLTGKEGDASSRYRNIYRRVGKAVKD